MKTANNEEFEYFQAKVFLFNFVFLEKIRHCIKISICLALIIINSIKIPKKLFGLTDLPEAQTFFIHKVAKIIMIDYYENFVFTTF